GRRNHPHQRIIDRMLEPAAVNEQLDLVVEHMGRRLRHVLAVLIAALTHDVPEQDTALRGIDHVVDGRSKGAKQRGRSSVGCLMLVIGCHWRAPFLRCFGCLNRALQQLAREICGAAQLHFSVMATSPGIPPGKSMISTLSLYPRSRKYFAQS